MLFDFLQGGQNIFKGEGANAPTLIWYSKIDGLMYQRVPRVVSSTFKRMTLVSTHYYT